MQLQSLLHGTPPLRKLPWVVVYDSLYSGNHISHRSMRED